jgi:phenylpyruvate tautomerase PptA (4-oxalocrotonate tautomerase family)
MPMIELTYAAGTIPDDKVVALASELGATLRRWEGAPDTPFFRDITWAYLHEVPRGHVVVDGRPAADVAPRYRVTVTVPVGALSERRRDGLIADVTTMVLDAAGTRPDDGEASMRVWVLVHEMPDGWWGAAGGPVHYAALKAVADDQRANAGATQPA